MKMMQSLLTRADLHAATCFLNSLLREWNNFFIYRSNDNLFVSIPVSQNKFIKIPLLRYSLLGRYEYSGKFYFQTESQCKEINFEDLLNLICIKLEAQGEINLDKFKKNVLSSRDNIYKALQVHAANSSEVNTFIDSEQALVIGHNFHPTPKSRDNLSTLELYNFAPEFKGKFKLQWLLVNKSILLHIKADNFTDHNWLNNLFSHDYKKQIDIPGHMVPIPMHPWQWAHLQKNIYIAEYIQSKQIIVLEPESLPWAATSALRTIYRDTSPYMLKFSMNLKLTNSLRVLLCSEVARGILLHDVLETSVGKEFCREFPLFQVITEPAYFGIKDKQGEIIESTLVVCRINPFNVGQIKNKYMLASLIQNHPFGGANLLLQLIQKSSIQLTMYERLKKWFNDYLKVVIKPLLIAYSKYGIIMEGHQQNIVLALDDGFPVASYFRDCQDHAYSDHGYHTFAKDAQAVRKNTQCVVDQEVGCHYFIYQVMLNSTFNLITTLAYSQQIGEQELLGDLHTFIQSIKSREDIKDSYCLDIILTSTTLWHKRNFKFALTQINDNNLPCHPLEFYTPVANLILPNKYPVTNSKNVLYQRYFPGMNKTITLRLLNLQQDLELFIIWNQNPRVAKFWKLDNACEAIEYLEDIFSKQYHKACIIEVNHLPIGYVELYWAKHDLISQYYDYDYADRGFHLFIGEDSYLGVVNTKHVFEAIMQYLYWEDNTTQRIVTEPNMHNHRFIKYMQIIPGWQFVKEVNLPDKRAAIFLSQRSEFVLESML